MLFGHGLYFYVGFQGKYKELGLPNYIASEVAEIATICKLPTVYQVTHTESLHLSLTTLPSFKLQNNVMFLNYYNRLNSNNRINIVIHNENII
jgi:hypothetical protein